MRDPATPFDRRTFARTFAACVAPPLAFVVVFLADRRVPAWLDPVIEPALMASLWAWILVYIAALVWCVYTFVSRDHARGRTILVAMIAAAVVGVGAVAAYMRFGYAYA